MTNDRQPTSIEFLYAELYKRMTVWHSSSGNSQVHIVLNSGDLIRLINEAKEMYNLEIESAVIKQCAEKSTSEASLYSEGYQQGYNRAIELSKWAISNLIPPHDEQR